MISERKGGAHLVLQRSSSACNFESKKYFIVKGGRGGGKRASRKKRKKKSPCLGGGELGHKKGLSSKRKSGKREQSPKLATLSS